MRVRIAAAADKRAASQELWKGLLRFNRQHAGPLHHKRTVLCVRDAKGKLLGGLIMQSYWYETYRVIGASAPCRARRGASAATTI